MISRTRRVVLAALIVVAVITAGALGFVFAGVGQRSDVPVAEGQTTDPGVAPGAGEQRSSDELGEEFLSEWVDDGRVVRRDQGNDTVSEGQAYGLLIALAVDDEQAFDEIWTWTKDNLQREDGLLAWRWDGAVVDDEPASDADLDVARALVLAGAEFQRPELTAAGNAHSAVILDTMTVQTGAGRILLPGKWAAAAEPYAYNPSYASPAAFAVLGRSTGDPRWAELGAGSAAVTTAILAASDLPPDWAQVHADGSVDPMPGPQGTGADVRYSYDAARLALRYAESCTPGDVAIAGELAPTLDRTVLLAAELDLGGSPLSDAVHPLAYGARAASLAATGDDSGARDDLTEALVVSDRSPTYYGAAWVALAPIILESSDLGACPPLEEV